MADEFDLKPTSRAEEFLDVILRSLGGDTPDIPQPAWRYEEYLAAIANAIQNGGGGSGGGVLEISVDNDTGALNKTWQEIHDALLSGKTCIVHEEFDNGLIWGIVVCVSTDGSVYSVDVNNWTARTDSANGYPIAS